MKMTLKSKISFIVIFIWVILAGAIYLGSQFIILNSFLQLEEKQAHEDVLRVNHAIKDLVDSVFAMTTSWAIWDDTYHFIQDRNKSYIKSNLTTESFASTKMDLVLYYNSNGNLVYGLGLNADRTKEIPPPPALLQTLTPTSSIVSLKNIHDTAQGLISLPTGLLMVGSHPIVTSVNTGPVRGVIIMAKYLTKDALSKIIDSTQVNVSLYTLDAASHSATLASITDSILKTNKNYLTRNANNTISEYGILRDVNNQPIILLKTTTPRTVYAIGMNMTRFYGAVFIAYSFLIVLLLWTLLQHLIIKRIVNLNSEMHSFTKPTAMLDLFTQRLSDEVTDVADLYHHATHDPLTGLANRNLLYQAFNHFISINPLQQIALLFLDMDKFKHVNDTLGHDTGDKLLIAMSKQLSSCLRENDLAARLGGDEFVVMLVNVNHEEILAVAHRIFNCLSKPILIQTNVLYLTSSMGISIYPEDSSDISSLLKNADIALYQAKEHGGNHYQFYSHAMYQALQAAKQNEIELQLALDNNEFILYYQPVYDALTKSLISIEALVRWQHPSKGLLSAAEFINLAEESGLIVPIGRWVLNTACMQAKNWLSKGLLIAPIAVNLSTMQFKYTSINQLISTLLEDHQLDPKYLELELTETGFVNLTPGVLEELNQLRLKGVRLIVDDFGMGYSGLGYLRRLPISKLKIDKSFIIDLERDPDARAITLAIISIAHQLNLQVIAEGVETASLYQFLVKNHIDCVQGNFLSPPLSPINCELLLIDVSKKQSQPA